VSRATFYRRHRTQSRVPQQPARRPSPRSLSRDERQALLDVLHEPRFVDRAPAAVYAQFLDENR
jgi:putative transposase